MGNDVSRIFCYSDDIARENGNCPSKVLLFFLFFFSIVAFIVEVMFFEFLDFHFNSDIVHLMLTINFSCFIILIIYFFRISRFMMRRMTIYVVDNCNNVYEITKKNNSDKVYYAAGIGGYLVDKLNDDRTIFKQLFLVVGFAINFITSKKISEEINNPVFVEQVMKDPKLLKNGNIYKLYNIKTIKEKRKYYEILSSYKNLVTDEISVNVKYKVFKSFVCYGELIKILKEQQDVSIL